MKKLAKYTKAEYNSLKAQKKEFYQLIKDSEEWLKDIRQKCDHPVTEFCTYSTRPGQYWDNTEICSICGEVVNWPYEVKVNPIERDGSHVHIKTDDKKLSSDFKTSGEKWGNSLS